ncbi:FxDxF family PEP-CTERM protein [Hydrogenophaga sp.]|uniref:FxDxF family PEP-CTERM protein n=1 Tax=Hydrogenophaga sp. TaxID=1904254 RepID=UPI002610232D|nr:FxDxF family PEP-CTERM protein [Hydrogenophaga sp.]MDM7948581.1 FxDxF family PEP-CTERM protein [Hydrogenophaga sp.]
MKLKLIAAAAVLAASGAANAAIDLGAQGNGDLFFSIWDGANSYTRDLGITLDGFEAALAAPGGLSFAVAADALFTSYLSTANLASAAWNIVASDASGARRSIYTYSTLPATTVNAGDFRNAIGNAGAIALRVNEGLAPGADSGVFAAGTTAYAGNFSFGNTIGGLLNFGIAGSAANNSYASGMNLVRVNGNPSGTAPTVYTPYADEGFAVRAYLDSASGNLTIAAVPEPETYAMLLAGLGLMGAIARRRRNKGQA